MHHYPQQDLNIQNRLVADDTRKIKDMLRVVEVFFTMLYAIKREKVDVQALLNGIAQLRLESLVKDFKRDRKDELVFQMLWVALVYLQVNRIEESRYITFSLSIANIH